jgi:predicted transcriptional regulator
VTDAKNLTRVPASPQDELSRRERQIVEALYRLGRATVQEVREAIADPPTYSAIRTLLGILERKGHIRHTQDGARYVYEPRVSRQKAQRSALLSTLHNFFDGSRGKLFSALLDGGAGKLTPQELDELSDLVERVRKEER